MGLAARKATGDIELDPEKRRNIEDVIRPKMYNADDSPSVAPRINQIRN